ncbi:MAG: hypothetical protein WCA84_04305 [Ignavibacteriaceae bacterium]
MFIAKQSPQQTFFRNPLGVTDDFGIDFKMPNFSVMLDGPDKRRTFIKNYKHYMHMINIAFVETEHARLNKVTTNRNLSELPRELTGFTGFKDFQDKCR